MRGRWAWPLIAMAVVALPVLVQSGYYQRLLNMALINVMLVLSLNLLLGYAGLVSLGHAGFFGIGAYTAALLSVNAHWPFLLELPVSGFVTALFGLALGVPTLRLRGHYLTLATVGFGEIVRLVLLNWKEVTRGQDGIGGIPMPAIGPLRLTGDVAYYYLALAIVLLMVEISRRIRSSKYGRALIALRASELATAAMGINGATLRITAFTLSAFFAGVAGSMYAHLYTYVSPDVFGFDVSILLLAMLLIGGMGTVEGAVVGAVLLTFLPEWIRFSKEYYMLVYGVGIVVLAVFMPGGVVGVVREKWVHPGFGLLKRRVRPQQRPSFGRSE